MKTLKDTFQNKKGFMLVEFVIGTLIAVLIFMVVSAGFKAVLTAEKIANRYNFGTVSSIFEDMNYTFSLAKTVSINGNSVTVERVDGCTVSYTYNQNQKKLEKTISGTCKGEKKLILNNVDNFSVNTVDTDTYKVVITTNGETNTIIARKM